MLADKNGAHEAGEGNHGNEGDQGDAGDRRERSHSRRRTNPAETRARHAEVEDPAVVLDAALRFLEVRQRSIAEVRRRLARAGYREDLVAGAIDRLTELGMLDDEAFARAWVESRDRAHPRGEHALMLELRQKGVEAPVIAEVLRARRETAVRWDGGSSPANANPDADPDADPDTVPTADEVAARRLLARHATALARIGDPRARRQRAYALLARNGFGPDIAGDVAREVVDKTGRPGE